MALLKVGFYFIKEKVLFILPRSPIHVWVVTDSEGVYLVKVCKKESGAIACCKGLESHYKYEKIELQ